ncbi:hypothetical protein OG589_04345 [Sphaerisporangium sp. NBC_01403]|uniref:hypothetical protein n=1 Tax=Sphaerisporangium sp. NBC_01403 TaxID=2903599 RepID=UPI003244B174
MLGRKASKRLIEHGDWAMALAEVAEETVRLLLELVDGADHVDPAILPARLIVRESA